MMVERWRRKGEERMPSRLPSTKLVLLSPLNKRSFKLVIYIDAKFMEESGF
jgi:hypothetical protein